jgi:hypothetical protein
LSHLTLDHETMLYQKSNVNPIETKKMSQLTDSLG